MLKNNDSLITDVIFSTVSKNCTVLGICPEKNLSFSSPFYSMVWDFQMFCGQANYNASLISTLFFTGFLVGAMFWGQISDIFGRRKIVLVLLASSLISSSSCALAQSWITLAILRFLVGFSIGGILNVNFTLTMELIPPEQRLFLAGT